MNPEQSSRSSRAARLVVITLVVDLLLSGSVAFATPASKPVVVSPGSIRQAMHIGDACPTFSWAAAEGAAGYELVVWRLSEPAEESGEFEAVVEETLPRGALSWTPSLGRCLERGGNYAWAVRAIDGEDKSEWSDPALFAVTAGPTEAEFQEALTIVRRYLAATRRASGSLQTPNLSPSAATEDAGEPATGEDASVPEDVLTKLLAAPDAIGIGSDVTGTTGVTFGIRGISNSVGDGSAGVVGQSTAASGDVAGVVGQVASAGGAAGEFDNTAGGDILRGFNNGIEVFSVEGSGAVRLTGGLKDSDGSAFFDNTCGDNQHLTGISDDGAITCASDSGDVSQVTAGSGLSGGGASGSVSLAHADLTSFSGSNNSGGVVLQDIFVDGTGLGHLISVGTTNLDARYSQGAHVTSVNGLSGGTISSNLTVSGYIRTNSPTSSIGTGDIVADDDLKADDDVFVGDDLSVSGNTTVDGTVNLNGDVELSANLFMQPLPTGSQTGSVCYQDTVFGDVIIKCSSSRRFKENITLFGSGVEVVEKLRPVAFQWKENGVPDVGLLAEEVEIVNPLFVTYDNGRVQGVKYDRLVVLLINAVKELQSVIEKQQLGLVQLRNSIGPRQPFGRAEALGADSGRFRDTGCRPTALREKESSK